MHIVILANCTLYINMYFLSALYTLRSVPIVKVILVILFKKKKRKTTRTSVWVKISKLCHKKPRYLSFPWKGRESFISNFIKTKNLVHFLPFPPACKIFFKFRHCVDDARQNSRKNLPKIHFFCKFCTFSVTEGYAI